MSKILILILLIAGLVVGVYLVGQQTGFFSHAGTSVTPKEIKISNISDNSFAVSWITNQPTTGFISYSVTPELGTAVSDDRDTEGRKDRFTHHVTLTNLSPDTLYYFKIGSGAEIYDNKGNSYEQKTAPVTSDTPPLPETLFGKVVKADQSAPQEGLVYFQVNGSTVLSTYLREEGKWLITLNNARASDLGSYISIEDSDILSLFIEGATSGTAEKQFPAKEMVSSLNLSLDEEKTITFYEKENLKGDLNNDGKVNAFDFALALKRLILK